MKMLRTAAALFLLACVPAFAQQVPLHSVPIGRGPNVTGYSSAAPGIAGQPLVSEGAAADPAFGPVANSGLTAGPANTLKGSLDGSSVTDEAVPACTGVSQSLRWTAGVGFSCGNVVLTLTTGYDMPINFGLSASASGNALTINLTQASGSAPTSSSPVLVPFRSTVATAGTVIWTTITAAQSVVVPSGATLGASNGVPFRVWIFLGYNSGAPELGVATCSNSTTIFPCASWENTLPTSVNISGSADAGGVLYATTGVAADAVRIVGYCEFGSGLTTAGTWASSCTTLQVFGPGVKKPGDTVQKVFAVSSTPTTGSGTTFTPTVPSATMTVAASPDLFEASAKGSLQFLSSGVPIAQMFYNNGGSAVCTTAVGANTQPSASAAASLLTAVMDAFFTLPSATTQFTIAACIKNSTAANTQWCSTDSGPQTCTIELIEIMGRLDDENDSVG